MSVAGELQIEGAAMEKAVRQVSKCHTAGGMRLFHKLDTATAKLLSSRYQASGRPTFRI